MFDYSLFFLIKYKIFAENGLDNLVDKNIDENIFIYTILLNLSQQIIHLYIMLVNIKKTRF